MMLYSWPLYSEPPIPPVAILTAYGLVSEYSGVRRKERTEDPRIFFIFPARPQSQSSGSLLAAFPGLAIIGSF